MGRPTLAVGTYGAIRTKREATKGGSRYSARALYRDFDGHTREVERHRPTQAAAERALKEAFRDRSRATGGAELTPDTRVRDLATAWWTEFERLQRSPTTVERYRARLDKQILPGVGALRVRELTTGAVERLLRVVETRHGAAAAKMTRTVLSALCRYACQHDLVDRNPVRETSAISVKPRRAPFALALACARQLLAALTYDPKAVRCDLVDLVAVMAATGIRVGEVLALRWDAFDWEAGTLEVRGTVIRIKGLGLVINQPKTRAGFRRLELSAWCVRMLVERRLAAPAPPKDRTVTVLRDDGTLDKVKLTETNMLVFPSQVVTLREVCTVDALLRAAFLRAGLDITSHALRKTVATAMDEAGLSARAAADQLGHEQVSFTQNTYYGRKTGKTGAAAVMEALDHDGPSVA